jgi:diguanylate cyclase (GGDEF)-like protein
MQNKSLRDSVIPLGPFLYDDRFGYNSFLLINEPYKVLIDLTPFQTADPLIASIEKHIKIDQLSHLVIQYKSISHLNTLNAFIEKGFKGDIITSAFVSRQLKGLFSGVNIYSVEDIGYHLIYKNKIVLNFITLGYLPLPEMFATYMPATKILFSSTLFGSYYTDMNPEIDYIKKAIFSFHHYMIPSSDFLKKPLENLSKLDIEFLYPTFGYLIEKTYVKDVIDFTRHLDFFNTHRVLTYKSQNLEQISYTEILNHMIRKLQDFYSRIDILDTFVGSFISLDPDTLEIKKTSLTGYKLWNGFFEFIHAKKGMGWLLSLEPLVNKYYQEFGIEKPISYRTIINEITLEKNRLEQQRVDLEQTIEGLNEDILKAKDLILRCPITSLYNQEMFKQMMLQTMEKMQIHPKKHHFILTHLDLLPQINQKYGKKIGDESLRHFAYIIHQVKIEKTMIYKQNGPGIYIYMPDADEDSIIKCANKLKTQVMDSNLFIEKSSCSISIVSLDEIDMNLTIHSKADEIINILDQRMAYARKKGHNELVDRYSDIPKPSEGLILLVDEDPISQNMIYRIFKRVNFDVKIAKDVNDALLTIESSPIDIILSEINLSKIDGFTLKRKLNENNLYAKIPFIMVSHNKTLENIRRGNLLDVDLILEKPIIPDELIGHVKRFKERK